MKKDFERIVYAYSDNLYRIAMHYMKNPADAQDIVQQTFLKLVENRKIFDSPDHEKAWLIRVCINLCKDSLKSSWHKRVSPLPDHAQPPVYRDPHQLPMLDYIRTLPPNQKTAIYLFYYEELPVKEIAQVMDTNENTVLSWLRRGRKSLKKIIKEEL